MKPEFIYNAETTAQGVKERLIYLSKLKARKRRLEAELEQIRQFELAILGQPLPPTNGSGAGP